MALPADPSPSPSAAALVWVIAGGDFLLSAADWAAIRRLDRSGWAVRVWPAPDGFVRGRSVACDRSGGLTVASTSSGDCESGGVGLRRSGLTRFGVRRLSEATVVPSAALRVFFEFARVNLKIAPGRNHRNRAKKRDGRIEGGSTQTYTTWRA